MKKLDLNLFRRIAGRYMEVFCDMPVEIGYIGIRPVFYPVKLQKRTFADPLMQRIYDVSVDTLRMCMHEHYEDCPWREQALYALDSRNQMLCGYYAFKGHEFQRSSLLMIAKNNEIHEYLAKHIREKKVVKKYNNQSKQVIV